MTADPVDPPTTHVVHDLGCTEPCTCGAWDKVVEAERNDEDGDEATDAS